MPVVFMFNLIAVNLFCTFLAIVENDYFSSFLSLMTMISFHFAFLDPCKNKACKFYSKCKIGTDGQPSCSCSSACPLIYKPVCGSDDEDYANQCLMEYEACTKQTEIVVKSQGECSKNRLGNYLYLKTYIAKSYIHISHLPTMQIIFTVINRASLKITGNSTQYVMRSQLPNAIS